ncbi:S49 family peptidase [uncultured Umboniibacter sp.]|uniref:S49 family peptidase n=1 Tax=uncultured Umboniibacter sp. TaxID=1798917 RepID=UPI00262BAF4F|nr:S49 family peptidase [uncultured Umboniibacter sp.]
MSHENNESAEPSEPVATVSIPIDLARELIVFPTKELRSARRSRLLALFLRPAIVIMLVVIAYNLGDRQMSLASGDQTAPHIAVLSLKGDVGSGGGVDADVLIPALQRAFEASLSKAVLLKIDSPGGSPVHADRIYNEIDRLQTLHPNKPVYAVIGDLGASAAYYIAAAADEIHVNPSSVVGSIGVISSSFGFTELMDKVGVERRVITSGTNKSLMDPYQPLPESLRVYWETMLGEVHENFIEAVIEGRGERLSYEHPDFPDIFTGLVWTGSRSVELGLADGFATPMELAATSGIDHNEVNYTPTRDFLSALSMKVEQGISDGVSQAIAQGINGVSQTMEIQ